MKWTPGFLNVPYAYFYSVILFFSVSSDAGRLDLTPSQFPMNYHGSQAFTCVWPDVTPSRKCNFF